jgi:hypothetical protein
VLPLRKAANDFLNRSYDQIEKVEHRPFRHETALPTWALPNGFWRVLDAPVAADVPPLTDVCNHGWVIFEHGEIYIDNQLDQMAA